MPVFRKQKCKHFIHNLGFEESIEELVTANAQLRIDLADLSDSVAEQNATLNSLSGELSTLNRFVSVLNGTVEQMTLSGNKMKNGQNHCNIGSFFCLSAI